MRYYRASGSKNVKETDRHQTMCYKFSENLGAIS